MDDPSLIRVMQDTKKKYYFSFFEKWTTDTQQEDTGGLVFSAGRLCRPLKEASIRKPNVHHFSEASLPG
jgi:hypothetical protein